MSAYSRSSSTHASVLWSGQRRAPGVADLGSERRIRPPETERDDLAVRHRRPHARIIRKTLTDIRLEPVERILAARGAHAGLTLAGQSPRTV
jgi:hypothetical protein